MHLQLGERKLVFGLAGAWSVFDNDPAVDGSVARTQKAAGRGRWDGKRFSGRVTLYPDIRSIYADIEVTQTGLTLLMKTDWFPAFNNGKVFYAKRG